MNGNRFGTIFQVTTWGESHGPALGAIVDGCPSGLEISPADFLEDMQRRRGGSAAFSTPRDERDLVEIESGVFEGRTTGAPIALRIASEDARSADYEEFRHKPRPGHADLTIFLKHGHRDHRGGGRASARETSARVAAGVVAKKLLARYGIRLLAWVERVGPNECPPEKFDAAREDGFDAVKKRRDSSPLHLPFAGAEAERLFTAAETLRAAGDSWGGSLHCRVDGLPQGLGEPVFDKLGAVLAHAMMSLPAAVAFEAGGGDAMSRLPGSAVRDPIEARDGKIAPAGNIHGGSLGGMSTGLPLFFGVSFHAPTSIPRPILTADIRTGEPAEIRVDGRHDALPLPRAVPMVEAMAALALADLMLRAGRTPEKL